MVWANAAYRDRFDAPAGDLPDHRIANAFGQVLEQVPLTPRGPGSSRRRVAVPARDDAEPRWYELSETPGAAGETLGFALDADDLVAAEAEPPPLRRDADRDLRPPAHRPRGLRQEPPPRPLQPGADRPGEDRRRLARRPPQPARLPRTPARDPADAGAEGLRLLAAQALRARGGRPRRHLRGELAAPLRQDLPRHRPPAPAGRARLSLRGHLERRSSSSASTAPSWSSPRPPSTACPRRWRSSTPPACSSSSTPPSRASGASTRWSG